MKSDANPSQKAYFKALDGMRGIAALMVVVFHYSLTLFEPTGWFQQNFIFISSYAFVDLFFVLSGFVITHNYQENLAHPPQLKTFFIKRFARLYPLLFVTIMVYVAMKSYGILSGFQFDDGAYDWTMLFWETLDPLLFLNSTFLILDTEGLNPVSWSISAEMIAYTCFALVIYFARKNRNLIFVLLFVSCLVFPLYQEKYLFTGDFGFIRGLLNFSVGYFVYQWKMTSKKFNNGWYEWLVFPLIICSFYVIQRSSTELMNLILIPVFGWSVYVLSFEKGWVSVWLKSKVMQFFGKISYSIYLWHFIVLWGFYVLSWQILQVTPSKGYAIVGLCFVFVITSLIAHFSYQWIEKKGGSILKRKLIQL